MPKCTVACEVASELAMATTCAPGKDGESVNEGKAGAAVRYVAHHGNVCDNSFFNVPFVSKFDAVLNALDNVAARRRVNRLCLAAGVPLVEAGTTGYLGQVNVIDKQSDVACYECKTQETQKVFPICTIRSTPSAPVHTIVWAKELYKLLYGEKAEESMLYEGAGGVEEGDAEAGENGKSGDDAAAGKAGGDGGEDDQQMEPGTQEPSTYMEAVLEYRKLLATKSTDLNAVGAAAFELVSVFNSTEIQKQLDMERYKTAQKKPAPLDFSVMETAAKEIGVAPSSKNSFRATDVWSPAECVAELVSCLHEAAMAAAKNAARKGDDDDEDGPLLPAFDKDDDLAMRFVTAASNIRNHGEFACACIRGIPDI